MCANFNDCECLNATTGEHQGRWKADEEARMMEAARATRAFNPTQPYVPYAYFTVSQSHYAGQAAFNLPENGGMWLRDAAGRALNGTPALGGGPHMPAQGFGMESRLVRVHSLMICCCAAVTDRPVSTETCCNVYLISYCSTIFR